MANSTSRRSPCSLPSPPPDLRHVLAPEAVRTGVPRRSRTARWRAAVLILVHVLVALHIAHWLANGETLSPMEPSEAMYTIADGALNAGFVLLVLALLSTLVLGRWFCGWACHLVALQDLCAWLMLKCGVRPKPLRSRLLVWIPLVAGLYMFSWPAVVRAVRGLDAPPVHLALTKTEFWETFPGVVVAVITFLVTGFAIVYFLGAKGFCTYACPYGGLFGVVEPLAPMRIRVTDACRKCGHCTSACTSNVDVAREVHTYGMVVDPGCMKCRDCISVCPEDALYFGPGRPAAFKKRRVRAARQTAREFTRVEELLLLSVFAAALVVLNGLPELPSGDLPWAWDQAELYGSIPLLLAIGLAVLVAFATVFFLRLVRRRPIAFRGAPLVVEGRRTRKGNAALAFTACVLLAFGHATWVQVHMFEGGRMLERTAVLGDAPWHQVEAPYELAADVRAAVDASEAHFAWAEALTPFSDFRIPKQRAWLAIVRGDLATAQDHLDRALAQQPAFARLWLQAGRLATMRGDFEAAERAAGRALELDPDLAEAYTQLSGFAFLRGDLPAALALLERQVRRHPDALLPHAQIVTCLEHLGRDVRPAVAALRAAHAAHGLPGDALAVERLLVEASAFAAASRELLAGWDAAPSAERARLLARALDGLGRTDEAALWRRRAAGFAER